MSGIVDGYECLASAEIRIHESPCGRCTGGIATQTPPCRASALWWLCQNAIYNSLIGEWMIHFVFFLDCIKLSK